MVVVRLRVLRGQRSIRITPVRVLSMRVVLWVKRMMVTVMVEGGLSRRRRSSVVPLNVSRPYLKNEGRPFWCSAGSALLGLDIRKERRQEGG